MKYETIVFRNREYYLVPVEGESRRKVAVIAGHTSTNKGDWSNLLQEYEHSYWNKFITDYLPDWIKTFEHLPNATYTDRQKYMANLTEDFDLVIELHWNAYDINNDGKDDATGVECFTWKGNEGMEKVGNYYTYEMSEEFGLHDRGCKPIDSGNGAGFLKLTNNDAILLEPFFADNELDVANFDRKAYASIIESMIELYYEQYN